MAQPELNPDAVDHRKKGSRGKTKGRVVDLNSLVEVQNLLGDEPRAVDDRAELRRGLDERRHAGRGRRSGSGRGED